MNVCLVGGAFYASEPFNLPKILLFSASCVFYASLFFFFSSSSLFFFSFSLFFFFSSSAASLAFFYSKPIDEASSLR